MLNILSKIYTSKEMFSLYKNKEDIDSFLCGIILALNKKEIAIQMFSPDGNENGIIVLDINKVFRVDTNGQYIEKIKKLCSLNRPVSSLKLLNEHDILQSVIFLAIQTQKVVSIELMNSGYNDIIGVIKELKDDQCSIKLIDEYGFEDGFSYVSIQDITEITYSSADENRIHKLWELNSKNSN